jgi:2-C-methyl-D-erythritol 4-phosphate cytidylyltransferase
MVRAAGWRKVRALAAPPTERDPSVRVLAALDTLDPQYQLVLLHDGARPLLVPSLVLEALGQASARRVVAAATPVRETLKWVDQAGNVRLTPPRATLRHLQPPAAFPRAPVEAALRGPRAAELAIHSRDGSLAWLLEACEGCVVRLVRAGEDELEVQTSGDLAVAAEHLRRHGAS